tara:strand:- start:1385 stop:3478 length:2094 start_codon:yes stop_codon:yes gene_type:complete
MAEQQQEIEFVLKTKNAQKNVGDLTENLEIQRGVLIDLEKQLYELETAQSKVAKTNSAGQKFWGDQIKATKGEIKGEELALKDLNNQKRVASSELKTLVGQQKQSAVAGLQQNKIFVAVNKATGGLALKSLKYYKGLKAGAKAIKGFNAGLSGMKKALIATGIGALVVAVGLLIAYWDDITGAINGASSEQKQLAEDSAKLTLEAENQLAATEASENTLKMQGKSEKEILALKIAQTDEIIASTEIQLQQQKDLKKSQIDAAKRNQKIAAGVIAFLSAPITMLLAAVDALTYGLAKVGVLDKGTNLAEDFAMGAAKMIGFDPEAVAEEGQKTIDETEIKLRDLKNKRDGFKLQQDADDKKASDKRKKDKEKADQEELEAEKEKAAALERIRKGLIDTEAEERAERLREIKADYDEQIKLAELYYGLESEKVKELKAAQRLALADQQTEFDEEDKEKEEKESQEAADKLALDGETEAMTFEEQRLLIDERRKLLDEDETINDEDRLDLKKQFDDAEEELEQKKRASKQQTLNNLIAIGGAETGFGRAMLVAKQLIAAKELIQDARKSITLATNAGARSTVAVAEGAGQTAKIGFPQNIPMLIGYAAQAAGIIGAIKSAVSKTKGASASSMAAPRAGNSSVPTAASQSPAFNIVGDSGTDTLSSAIAGQNQQPIQTYVVANDVTTSQSLSRNIVEGASL